MGSLHADHCGGPPSPRPRFPRLRSIVPVLLLVAVAAAVPGPLLHFDLDHSLPEDGASVQEIAAVQLWFTGVPQDSATTVRLIDTAGELVETGALVRNVENKMAFSLPVTPTLPAGAYTVSWRSIGAGGHVVRGEFGFSADGLPRLHRARLHRRTTMALSRR